MENSSILRNLIHKGLCRYIVYTYSAQVFTMQLQEPFRYLRPSQGVDGVGRSDEGNRFVGKYEIGFRV